MHKVYYTLTDNGSSQALSVVFADNELAEALKFSEELRRQRREGAQYSFIVLASEDPNSVGQLGVDITGAGYDWKKRR